VERVEEGPKADNWKRGPKAPLSLQNNKPGSVTTAMLGDYHLPTQAIAYLL